MQLGSHHLRPAGVKAKEFEFPAYSSVEFPKVMKLLDLCSLDVVSRKFGSSVLAASSLYLQSERSRANLAVTTGGWALLRTWERGVCRRAFYILLGGHFIELLVPIVSGFVTDFFFVFCNFVGFELREIQACVNWMYPFAVVLSQKVMVAKKAFPGVSR